MAKKYVLVGGLSIASELLNFVNNELLPGTGVTKKRFWDGLDKCVHELAPINKKLLYTRDEIQKKIDKWHIDNKGKVFKFFSISFEMCNNFSSSPNRPTIWIE